MPNTTTNIPQWFLSHRYLLAACFFLNLLSDQASCVSHRFTSRRGDFGFRPFGPR